MQIPQPDMQTEELPEEIQSLMEEMREAKNAKIEAIGKEVARKRDEAVKFRKQSGIEAIWEEDNEYYLGIDDANRDSHPWLKSASTSGGISRTPTRSATRCTSFFNITRQFVDSASARMGDILLPAGDWNFSAKATPVQDDSAATGNMGEFVQTDQGAQQAQQIQSDVEKRAERGELKIQDWMIECSYHSENRKVIESAARLGTGILKGPVPEIRTSRKVVQKDGMATIEIVDELVPASRWVDCRNFFPDPACGDNIHKGSYTVEREMFTAKQLKDLKKMKGYLADQIDLVLEEGPNKKNYTDGMKNNDSQTEESDKYEVWYYYGVIDVHGLNAMNVSLSEDDSKKKLIPAVVTLVNDTPIKAHLNPLDTGEFPYDLMVWQSMTDSPWGIGVPRQGRTAQDMLNAACRALMDNAGLSSGPMLIIRQGAILPADGRWEVTARKVWYATESADIKSVQDAFTTINIPMVQAELQAIVQMAYKMMEDATGIFYIMQGQQGSAPDTVGGMELMHRNASAILRRVSRVYDERITEPHVRRYHVYLMCDPSVPEDCKGDMKIEAIGSTALVEREIYAMESMALLQLSANPIFGLDPESAMIEVLKTKRMIPEKWAMSEAKKKERAQQQPPPVPAIEVAKIRAAQDDKKLELDRWKTQVETTNDMKKSHDDMDRDLLYADTMSRRDQTTKMIRMEELKLKRETALAEREIKMLDYANKRGISLDQIKAELAKETMRLRTQKELAGVTAKAEQVATPAVEPPQHAPDGAAFQQ